MLHVFETDQSVLPIGKLIEKGYKVLFENESCLIKDSDGKCTFKVKMRGKSCSKSIGGGWANWFTNERKCHRFVA